MGVGDLLLVGVNQPYVLTLHKETLEVVQVSEIEGFVSVEYIYPYCKGQDQVVVLCNKDGNMVRYYINDSHLPLQPI